jgi:hypothetical protein
MGEVFAGRYELIDPVGHGGIGAVWRAWDHRRRRYVAAKVLQQSDAHTLLRFVREQAVRIDHPHVLAPASWAADDDKVLFTMDLVAGGSLAHLTADYGPLPPRFVCLLLDQLLAGLAAVHAEGIIHRDIKPANVLLEATGTARPHLRLSDFGISMRKGEPRLTETNYVVGTPGYFAPEQMLGAEPDFPADLFAVGLVALYLLEGQKPDARALVEHFAEHGTPNAPVGVPEPLWQVLAGLLQPDPHARFRTATGVRKALTSAVELLPDAEAGEEPVEVFDQIGPLPAGFGPSGPVRGDAAGGIGDFAGREGSGGPARGPGHGGSHESAAAARSRPGTVSAARADPRTTGPLPQRPTEPPLAAVSMSETGSFPLPPPPGGPRPPTVPAAPPQPTYEPGPPHGQGGSHEAGAAAAPTKPPGAAPMPRAHPPRPEPVPGADLPGEAAHRSGAFPLPGEAAQPPGVFPGAGSAPPSWALAVPGYAQPPGTTPSLGNSGIGTVPTPYGQPPTRPYTAEEPVPSRGPAHAPAHANPRRPGPPAMVAVPVLLLAFVCFAVGIWALTRP